MRSARPAGSTSVTRRGGAPEHDAGALVVESARTRTPDPSAPASSTTRAAGAGTGCEITLALPGTGDAVAHACAPATWAARTVVVALSCSTGGDRLAGGAANVVQIDLDELAVARETVRVAAGRLHTSPLYPLVRNHLLHVTTEAPARTHDAVATALAATTLNLVRALILSAAHDARPLRDARHGPTAARIQAYVAAHLRDPDLTPARIAAANAVSTRTLYTIYRSLGTSLQRSILDQRLQGARADLTSPGRRHHSIAAIARSWGFTNPSSFSQQFRRAFGVTPRRARTRPVPPSTS